jgi:hypothetical protein
VVTKKSQEKGMTHTMVVAPAVPAET